MAFATAARCNIAGRLVSYLLWSSFCGPVFPPKRQSGAERELQPWDGALRTLAQLSVDAPMMQKMLKRLSPASSLQGTPMNSAGTPALPPAAASPPARSAKRRGRRGKGATGAQTRAAKIAAADAAGPYVFQVFTNPDSRALKSAMSRISISWFRGVA